MERMHHDTHEENANLVALKTSLHCLLGCSVGEVMGMMFGAGLDLSNSTTIALGIVLAFVFGFLLTMLPLVRATVPMAKALKFALASDTLSITLYGDQSIRNMLVTVIHPEKEGSGKV
jgi:hypothetical protein